jgi:hypothetical protein
MGGLPMSPWAGQNVQMANESRSPRKVKMGIVRRKYEP